MIKIYFQHCMFLIIINCELYDPILTTHPRGQKFWIKWKFLQIQTGGQRSKLLVLGQGVQVLRSGKMVI